MHMHGYACALYARYVYCVFTVHALLPADNDFPTDGIVLEALPADVPQGPWLWTVSGSNLSELSVYKPEEDEDLGRSTGMQWPQAGSLRDTEIAEAIMGRPDAGSRGKAGAETASKAASCGGKDTVGAGGTGEARGQHRAATCHRAATATGQQRAAEPAAAPASPAKAARNSQHRQTGVGLAATATPAAAATAAAAPTVQPAEAAEAPASKHDNAAVGATACHVHVKKTAPHSPQPAARATLCSEPSIPHTTAAKVRESSYGAARSISSPGTSGAATVAQPASKSAAAPPASLTRAAAASGRQTGLQTATQAQAVQSKGTEGSSNRSSAARPSKPKQPRGASVAAECAAYLSSNPTAQQIAAALMPGQGQGTSSAPTDPHTLAMQEMLLATGLLEEEDLKQVLAVIKG